MSETHDPRAVCNYCPDGPNCPSKQVDDRGIPIYDKNLTEAPFCPDDPCKLCTGDSACVKERGSNGVPVYMTSWEWCQTMKTCAATVDWDRINEH